VPAALRAYQDVRLSAAQLIAHNSERVGRMYQFNMPGCYDGTDRGNERGELEILHQMIMSNFESRDQGSAVAQWQQAEKRLRESTGMCHDC
jgi:salicylate hydroxylase